MIDANLLARFAEGKIVILGATQSDDSYSYEGKIELVEVYDAHNVIVNCYWLNKRIGEGPWVSQNPRYPFKIQWYSGVPFNEGYVLYGLIGGNLEVALFSPP